MSDNRVDAQGSYLKMGDAASPEVFTAIGELADIPEIAQMYSERDRTTLADTHQKVHQGLPQSADFSVVVAWNPTDAIQAAMITACTGKTEKNFQLVYASSPVRTKTFTGKIMSYSEPYETVDKDLLIGFKIKKTSLFT